jgi:hypothetical protein
LFPERYDILLLTRDPSRMQKQSRPRESHVRHHRDKLTVECLEFHEQFVHGRFRENPERCFCGNAVLPFFGKGIEVVRKLVGKPCFLYEEVFPAWYPAARAELSVNTDETGFWDTTKAMKGADDQFDLIRHVFTMSNCVQLKHIMDFHGHLQVTEASRFCKHPGCDYRNIV